MQRSPNQTAWKWHARTTSRPSRPSMQPWLAVWVCLVASPHLRAQAPTEQSSDAAAGPASVDVPAPPTSAPVRGQAEEPVVSSAPAPDLATPTDPPFFSFLGDRVGKGIGVETSLMWPLFPGYLFQLRTAIPVAYDGRGQLVIGAQGHIPHDRSEEGRFMSLAGQVGLRGYLWKGLHVDALTTVGVGRIENSVDDGKTYNSLDVELMALLGWRFEAGPVYALLQPVGISSVVYRSNPWVIVGQGRQTSEAPIYIANVHLGAQF